MTAVRIDDTEWPAEELAGAELLVRNGRTLYLRIYRDDGEPDEYPLVSPVDPREAVAE